MNDQTQVIPPGSTIGILGGGQLGRMTSIAAARLGYRCHIFEPDEGCPASQVAMKTTTAAYDNTSALDAFARHVDVVTLEFENVPTGCIEYLSKNVLVRPAAPVLAIAQNRLKEKNFLKSIDVPTADYAEINSITTLSHEINQHGCDCILKSSTFGYDGKGQVEVNSQSDLKSVLSNIDGTEYILEKKIDFVCEVSVIIARNINENIAIYCPVENRHVHHILDTTIVPARIDEGVIAEAEATAIHIANKLQLVGLLAVEFFVTRDGRILVNEIAPRPHNSGHWTLDACRTSQFEQLVRAVTGLPLGSTERLADVIMKNLIGEEVEAWLALASDPEVRLHLYGKTEIRPDRKMGHVTRLFPPGTIPNV